jgi:uncharacterized protein (AIM24 family)
MLQVDRVQSWFDETVNYDIQRAAHQTAMFGGEASFLRHTYGSWRVIVQSMTCENAPRTAPSGSAATSAAALGA